MKFSSTHDVQQFLIEIDRRDLLDEITSKFEPDQKMCELFVKKRKKLITGLKDFRKRQTQKGNWRKSRWKYLKGIRDYHKSSQGKRFHRSLGRFLATREQYTSNMYPPDLGDFLKAVSSAKTHLFVMLEYYRPIDELVDVWLLLEEIIPDLTGIETKMMRGEFTLTETELDLLVRLTDNPDQPRFKQKGEFVEVAQLIKAFRERSTLSNKKVQELWEQAKTFVKQEHRESGDGERFYGLVIQQLQTLIQEAEGARKL